MSYLPAFRNDIYISYTHIDNKPLFEGDKGWVSIFRQSLLVRLHQLLGSEPSIWFDSKRQGTDWFSDKVLGEISSTALFVSILSPSYIESEWCLKELREFCVSANFTGGLTIKNRSRLIKVIKTPVPMDSHPMEMATLLGYSFYEIDSQPQRLREFSQNFDGRPDNKYWTTLDDVAYDIYQQLQRQKKELERPSSETKASVKTAALIKPAKEQETFLSYARTNKKIMESVRKQLESKGLIVWTDEALTPGTPVWEKAIEKHIEYSNCVIVIFSPEAKNSKWIRNELAYAELQKKTIYPLLASGSLRDAVPLGYITSQYIDIRTATDVEKGIEKLCNIINEAYSSNSESDTRDKS